MNTWFTIFVDAPKPDNRIPTRRNCAGQLLIHDGLATKAWAVARTKEAAKSFGIVQMFQGKNLGKLILTIPDECSYCGKPFSSHS